MLLPLLIAQLVSAQLPTATAIDYTTRAVARQQRTSSVTGVVHDSIANRPLAGATVQLVTADSLARFGQTVISDSLGFYSFREVPDGNYTLGFFHPMLDSLGIEPRMRAVTVSGQRRVMSDLAIPSASSLSAAVCGTTTNVRGTPALLIGIVRDALTREPVADVTVAGEWVEFSIGGSKLIRNTPRRVVTTRENGWFAICNVPSPGTMTLTASRSGDSTDVIEVEIPANGFLRRELFLGRARTVVVNEVSRPEIPAEKRALHVGDVQLSGTVTTSNGARPLANARVSIANGPATRTNARGEWTLTEAPAGTRSLEVRAVGYYPGRVAVDVVDGTPAISVSLATFKSVLDTMKVIANYDRYSNLAGFRDRRRSGVGRYVGADDIVRRNPLFTSDLFLGIPGVYVDYPLAQDLASDFAAPPQNSDFVMPSEKTILLRGITSRRCMPAIYINGQWIENMSSNDIDAIIKPDRIEGIEVYATAQTPPQFQPGMSGCGSIVFWTR